MKLKMLIAPCAIVLLSGCVSQGQSNLLVTPFGTAGIHSFAPPKSADNVSKMELTASRITKATQ